MPKTIDVTFKALGNRTLTASFDPTSFGKKPQVEQTQQQSSSVPAVMMGR
jgi:hypothetical protein